MTTFVGSTAKLSAAGEPDMPYMAFVYEDGLVLARPTWGTLTSATRDVAVVTGVADLVFSVMSLFAPIHTSGAAVGQGSVLRMSRRMDRAHQQFRLRAAVLPVADLAAEMSDAGWRTMALPLDHVAGWTHDPGARRRPGRLEIQDLQGNHYSLGGAPKALHTLAQLLSGYPTTRVAVIPGPRRQGPPSRSPMFWSAPVTPGRRSIAALALLTLLAGIVISPHLLPRLLPAPRSHRMVVVLCTSPDRVLPACRNTDTWELEQEDVRSAIREDPAVELVYEHPLDPAVLVAILHESDERWDALATRLASLSGVVAVKPGCDGGPRPRLGISARCVDPYAV